MICKGQCLHQMIPKLYHGTRGPWALALCLRTKLAIDKSSIQIAHTLFFCPRGSKVSLFSLYSSSFRHTGRFSKLPYLGMQLGHLQKFQKLHITLSFYPKGSKLSLFSMASGFRDTSRFSKFPYSGMKLGHWPKFRKLHIYSLSTPECWNWPYFHSMAGVKIVVAQ